MVPVLESQNTVAEEKKCANTAALAMAAVSLVVVKVLQVDLVALVVVTPSEMTCKAGAWEDKVVLVVLVALVVLVVMEEALEALAVLEALEALEASEALVVKVVTEVRVVKVVTVVPEVLEDTDHKVMIKPTADKTKATEVSLLALPTETQAPMEACMMITLVLTSTPRPSMEVDRTTTECSSTQLLSLVNTSSKWATTLTLMRTA